MRLLIKPLMLRPRPASSLYPGPERWIFDALEVNNLSKKMTKTLETMKRISLPRIFLLIHYQIRPNLLWQSPRRTKTVVLAEENLDDKVKAKILLSLASTLLPSRKTRTRIKIRKIYLILSTTHISKKAIMPTSVLKKSQKTSVGLNNLYVGD